MALNLSRQPLSNTKALASIESLPIIMMFIVLVSFGLGFFGVVHTGIVYSIHARTYVFESLRNRANYNHMRDTIVSEEPKGYPSKPTNWVFYQSYGYRTHGISSLEASPTSGNIHPTLREIKFPPNSLEKHNHDKPDVHNREVYTLQRRATDKQRVNPVWLMVQYGICLNAKCQGAPLTDNSN